MENNTLVESSFSAIINAPIETIDIPEWCFSLPEAEYQSCSPAHCSAGVTTAPDGRRMSINVEVLGGSPMVQHYLEEISERDHLRLESNSGNELWRFERLGHLKNLQELLSDFFAVVPRSTVANRNS